MFTLLSHTLATLKSSFKALHSILCHVMQTDGNVSLYFHWPERTRALPHRMSSLCGMTRTRRLDCVHYIMFAPLSVSLSLSFCLTCKGNTFFSVFLCHSERECAKHKCDTFVLVESNSARSLDVSFNTLTKLS